MTNATVIGASGYTGGELLRLLVTHPDIDEIVPVSRTNAGKPVSSVHRNLNGIFECDFEDLDIRGIDSDVVFLAAPNGEAMKYAPELLEKGLKVIDLSADFRLDKGTYEKFYMKHESPELIKKAVYGLPELFRDKIKKARMVANPGCYVTSAILAIAPLAKFKDKLDMEKVVVDSKSGTSGAGAKLTDFLTHGEVHDNLKPYNVVEHRHRPEMEHILSESIKDIKISFTPTLMPIIRGILTNVHVFGKTGADLRKHYEKFYNGEPFIRIVDTPQVKDVVGTNFCDIGVHADKHTDRILVISAIDNLIKGASGQAVQNMNLMFGFDEWAGLTMVAGHP